MLGDGLRLVTIRCYTDCYLAELDRVDFKKVLKKIEMREINSQIQFLC